MGKIKRILKLFKCLFGFHEWEGAPSHYYKDWDSYFCANCGQEESNEQI